MRITRRLLDAEWTRSGAADPRSRDTDLAGRARRLIAARVPALLALVTSLSTVTAMTASCSSSEGDAGDPLPSDADGGADAALDADREDVDDAGIADVVVVDSAPLTVVCDEPPCAVALTTTLTTSTPILDDEGYCALLDDGTVACWGADAEGQVGNPEASGFSRVPLRVSGLSKVTALNHTCAVDSDGSVFCWGRGPFLQSEASAQTVESDARSAAAPWSRDEGRVQQQQLRRRRVRHPPRSERGLLGLEFQHAARRRRLAVGGQRSAAADRARLRRQGHRPWPRDVRARRRRHAEELGIQRQRWSSHRPQPSGIPGRVALDHVSMVDTVQDEACAVANGVGWCWGGNDVDNAGALSRALPSAVDTPEPITRIATSRSVPVRENSISYLDRRRWCATGVSGSVYCWGLNNAGQAGSGTKEFVVSPVKVAGLPAPAAEVKVMPYSTCAILTTGKVYCWGSNFYGQLGAGLPQGSVLEPVEVKLP